MGGVILMSHVYVFQPFGLDKVVRLVRDFPLWPGSETPATDDSHEVRLVIAQVAGVVRVLDDEAEPFRQLGEAENVVALLQEPGELFLELIVTRDEIERRFPQSLIR